MSFVEIKALYDGFPLVGKVFEPPTPEEPCKVCVIANATGISQLFYWPAATFLAEQGIRVVTFDYRYTGLSFSDNKSTTEIFSTDERISILKKHAEVNLVDFARKDIAGVIDFVSHKWANDKLYYVGHSLGCHVLPLIGQSMLSRIHKVLWISATNPYVYAYKTDAQRKGWERMSEYTKREGYFDGQSYNFGGLLPAAAFNQWYYWATLKAYAAGDPDLADEFRSYKGPVCSIGFCDDVQVMSSPDTLERWCTALPYADIDLIKFNNVELGCEKIGHNDMFRAKNAVLWHSILLVWLRDEQFSGGERRQFVGSPSDLQAKREQKL